MSLEFETAYPRSPDATFGVGGKYAILQVDPTTVYDDLLRLWSDNLAVDPNRAEAKYSWTYLEPPLKPHGVFVLSARQGTNKEQLVGTAGLLYRDFTIDGRSARAGLTGDLAVSREHRTVLPAIKLVRRVRAAAMRECELVYGYPNRASEGVFTRCGYTKLGILTRYVAVLDRGPHVQKRFRVPTLPMALGAILDVAHDAVRAPRLAISARKYRVDWLASVDARFDDLWSAAQGAYPIVGRRDREFLHWRFMRHPSARFEIAALIEKEQDERLSAYAVIEQRSDGVAQIRDIFGHPDAMGALLDLLLRELRRRQLCAASINFLGSAKLVELLASRGFARRPSERAVVVAAGASMAKSTTWLQDPRRWHLTDADEDV